MESSTSPDAAFNDGLSDIVLSSALSNPAPSLPLSDNEWTCKTGALLPACTPQTNQLSEEDGPLRLALTRNKYWPAGKVLRIKFLSRASAHVQQRIKFHAKKWTEVANIGLCFVDSGPAEIRISFDVNDGSWSYVGTDCLSLRSDEATMNFGWFHDNTREEEFARVTLHEFGHALGCIHEHQSASSRLKWDQANIHKVYNHFKINDGWGPKEVNDQVFNKYPANELEATAFDDKSIMLYPYPAHLFADKKGTSLNQELSETDKELIGRIYPFRSRSTGEYNFNPSNSNLNFRIIDFEPRYSKPPQLALGLSRAHMAKSGGRNICLSSEAVSSDGFRLSICSGNNTKLYSGGANWVEVEADNENIQSECAIFECTTVRFVNTPATAGHLFWKNPAFDRSVATVYFPRPFTLPPRVIIWISGFSFSKSRHVALEGTTKNIKSSSFDLAMHTWQETAEPLLNWTPWRGNAKFTWIACSCQDWGVATGCSSFDKPRFISSPKTENSGRASFYKGHNFPHPPKVVLAVSKLCIRNLQQDLRFEASATEITKEGFQWNLNAWDDSVINAGTIQYIAFAGRKRSGDMTKDFEADPGHWSEVYKATGVVPKGSIK